MVGRLLAMYGVRGITCNHQPRKDERSHRCWRLADTHLDNCAILGLCNTTCTEISVHINAPACRFGKIGVFPMHFISLSQS